MYDQVYLTIYAVSEREIRKAVKYALEIETADNPLGVFREIEDEKLRAEVARDLSQ